MLIRRLVLENFGLYSGLHEFDLVPKVKRGRTRPIVLFGGKNGAGKTTILEAVQLALYGKTALGARVRQSDYELHLRNRIHRSRTELIQPRGARVGVEFDYVLRGDRQTYYVERSWAASNGDGAREMLQLLRKNEQGELIPLADVESEFWQAFVRDIVPEGLSQLFFFDGEKIKQIAEDDTSDIALADSIKSLLGLDIVDRLDSDLAIYASRQISKLSSGKDHAALVAAESQLQQLTEEIKGAEEATAATRTRLDGVRAEIRRKEEELRREGHDFAAHRERAAVTHATLNAEIDAIERQIRAECEGVFPLALCPTVAQLLKSQLDEEEKSLRERYLAGEWARVKEKLLSRIKRIDLKLKAKDADAVMQSLRTAIDDVLPKQTASRSGIRIVQHELSDSDSKRVHSWLASGRAAANTMRDLCRRLDTATRRLRNAQRELDRVPEADAIKPVVEEVGKLRQQLGAVEQDLASQEERLNQAKSKLSLLLRQRDRILTDFRGIEDHERRIAQVQDIRAALSEYLLRLTDLKVAQLKSEVAACFNRLCRKGDVLRRIEIDPKSFRVTLFDAYGQELPRLELSSGEKQIYAVAMLWGLARTSGRPLPVIVDTPLGRLDSDHRRHLIERYFPHASHQVILLSTDTEIDLPLFNALSTEISHVYHLQFDASEGRTTVNEEYFWKGDPHA